MAVAEAILVLFITQLPLLLLVIVHVMETDGAKFTIGTAKVLFSKLFSVGDIFSYIVGILGSSLAYALLKIGKFASKPHLMLPLIVAPILLFFFASPVFIQFQDGQVGNKDFTSKYVWCLLFCAVALWVNALYQARAFFEVRMNPRSASDAIKKDIEND